MLGVLLWAGAGAGIHFAAPSGVFSSRIASLVLMLATLPAAWATVRLAGRIGQASGTGLLESVALVAFPPALLDGIGLTWAPNIYAANPADQRGVAAALLWFLGASFAITLLRRRADFLSAPAIAHPDR
jgi:hypothetical protein